MTAPGDAARQDAVEMLDHGVLLEWIEDRKIVVYCPPDGAQETLEALFARADRLLREWPTGNPHLVIIDLETAAILPTPYVRERGRAMWELRPDVLVATALIIGRSVGGQFLKVATARMQNPKALMAVHFSREDAVAWLKGVVGITSD